MKKIAALLSVFAFLLSVNAGNCIQEQTSASVKAAAGTTQVKSANTLGAPAVAKTSLKAEPTKQDLKYEELYNNLSFTNDQKSQAKELRTKQDEKITPLNQQLRDKKREISAVNRSELTTKEQEKKIAALEKDIKKLRKQISAIKKEGKNEFDTLLTLEQKVSYKELNEKNKIEFVPVKSFNENKKVCPTCRVGGCAPECEQGCPDNCPEKCPCRKMHSKKCSDKCSASDGKRSSKFCPFGCPKGCPKNCDDSCRCKRHHKESTCPATCPEETE